MQYGKESGLFLTHSEHGLRQLIEYAKSTVGDVISGSSMIYQKFGSSLLVMSDICSIAYCKSNVDQYPYSATLPMYIYYDIYKTVLKTQLAE